MEEQKSYKESLQFVAEADDNCFPDFLWNPVFGVDEDNTYYQIATSSYGLSTEVRKLRRKYANFNDWQTAMQVYNDYMQVLAEKYGGVEIVMESYNLGAIDEYVPVKPQLKPSKRNKQILRTGILPAKSVGDMEYGIFSEMSELYFPNDSEREDQFSALTIDEKIPKWAKKSIQKASKKLEEKNRVENARNGVSTRGSDLITQIMEKLHAGEFKDLYEKEDQKSKRTAIDDLNDLINERYIDPDIESASLEETYGIYQRRGKLIRAEDERNTEIIKDLYSIGIDLIGGARKNDTHIRLARHAMGLDEDERYMTKKELKKYKKKLKKEKEWQEKASRTNHKNNVLARSLLGERRPDFITEDEGGVRINFRDIFKD